MKLISMMYYYRINSIFSSINIIHSLYSRTIAMDAVTQNIFNNILRVTPYHHQISFAPVFVYDWKVKVFPWEPSKFWWALCYVAFCLVPPSHCFFQVSPGSTLTRFFLLQKSNRPGFVFSVNQCQHHSASCMQHADCKIVLEDAELASDRIFFGRHIVVCGHITYESVTYFLKDFLHPDREKVLKNLCVAGNPC